MNKVVVSNFSISIDGFGAGLDQSLEQPLGKGGMELHNWVFVTKNFNETHGQGGGEEGIDNDFSVRSFENVGAWILGRNMFGPIRGEWGNSDWKGWWGDNPPYHVPVYVLTHHQRESLPMEGGTIFHFETGGIEHVLEKARAAANGKNIRIGGGVSTIRQYLKAGLIDELHLAVSPVFLGSGEHLFEGINLHDLGYQQVEQVQGERANHVIIKKVVK